MDNYINDNCYGCSNRYDHTRFCRGCEVLEYAEQISMHKCHARLNEKTEQLFKEFKTSETRWVVAHLQKKNSCIWVEEQLVDDRYVYYPMCQCKFHLFSNRQRQNVYKFCPYCGKKIRWFNRFNEKIKIPITKWLTPPNSSKSEYGEIYKLRHLDTECVWVAKNLYGMIYYPECCNIYAGFFKDTIPDGYLFCPYCGKSIVIYK